MRVAQLVLRSAAAAGIVSLAAACVIPPAAVAPRPEEDRLPAPDVAFDPLTSAPFGTGSDVLAYSTTRDAYTAVFEVDQRGQVRVLSPASPRANARSSAGTSYLLSPMLHLVDREFMSPATDFSRVPFVFVLTSDTPIDLSPFGTGKAWTQALSMRSADPDSVIARVAERVLPDASAYGSDFAYVGPQLRVAEQTFASACARPLEDVHDYMYYRDLWAVFTPADQRLSINPYVFAPAIGWSSYSALPLAAYRADLAPAAFYSGCSSRSSQFYALGYTAGVFNPYGNGFYSNPYLFGVPRTTTPPFTVASNVPLPHVPRIPAPWIPLQAPGTVASTPSALGLATLWRAPGRVAAPPASGSGIPFGVRPVERWAYGEARTPFGRTIERRGFEQQPNARGMLRTGGFVTANGNRWNGAESRTGAMGSVQGRTPGSSSGMPSSAGASYRSPAGASSTSSGSMSPAASHATPIGGGAAAAVQARAETKAGHN